MWFGKLLIYIKDITIHVKKITSGRQDYTTLDVQNNDFDSITPLEEIPHTNAKKIKLFQHKFSISVF